MHQSHRLGSCLQSNYIKGAIANPLHIVGIILVAPWSPTSVFSCVTAEDTMTHSVKAQTDGTASH